MEGGFSLFSVEFGMKMTARLLALPIPKGSNHSAQGCDEGATLSENQEK